MTKAEKKAYTEFASRVNSVKDYIGENRARTIRGQWLKGDRDGAERGLRNCCEKQLEKIRGERRKKNNA